MKEILPWIIGTIIATILASAAWSLFLTIVATLWNMLGLS